MVLPEDLAAVRLALAREGRLSAVWLPRSSQAPGWTEDRSGAHLHYLHPSTQRVGPPPVGPPSLFSFEPGSSPGLLPSHQLRFPVPTDFGPAMNTGGHIWEVDLRWLPRLELGGARQAGPSSNLEEFLNYPLAGNQRPEQAWAGPAGWDSKEPPGSRPHHGFLHPPCCVLTRLCAAGSSRGTASSQGLSVVHSSYPHSR